MDARKKASKIKKKYGTNDPYCLAEKMGILLFFEDLGNIKGYYNKQFNIKQIHINKNLPEKYQLLVCAHELGHAVLHANTNAKFLIDSSFDSLNEMEIEATLFAGELFSPNDYIDDSISCFINKFLFLYCCYIGGIQLPEPVPWIF